MPPSNTNKVHLFGIHNQLMELRDVEIKYLIIVFSFLLLLLSSFNGFTQTVEKELQDNLKSVKVFSFLGFNIVLEAKDEVGVPLVNLDESNYFYGDRKMFMEKWMVKPDKWFSNEPLVQPNKDENFEKWMFHPSDWGSKSPEDTNRSGNR